MNKIRAFGSLLAIFSAVALSWPSSAEQPIRIGASIAITGKYSLLGGYGCEGYLLCQKHANEQGGVLGRPIESVIYDDGSDEKTAVGLYEKVIAEDKVDVVLGPYSSPITDVVADVTEKHRMLMIAPMAGTTPIWEKGRRNLVMVISPNEGLSAGVLDLAVDNGLKTLAVINQDGQVAKAAAKGTSELAKRKGLEMAFSETYPNETADFSGILNKAKAAKPDLLVAASVRVEDPLRPLPAR
jgi:branched-chain amino acid transport system substrate-binding protein